VIDGRAEALERRLALAWLGHVFGQDHLGLTFGPPACPGNLDGPTVGVASDKDSEGPHPRLTLVQEVPRRKGIVVTEQ
jgi:hypothetical protein